MIFAKLDVCFWRHKKFKRAGAAACGYYAAALAYLREDETRDGVLEDDVIGQLLNVGEREAAKLLERLIDVGLFERVEGGYLLLGYAEKNETRDAIEARRAATNKRVGEWRKSRRNGVHVPPQSRAGNALHTEDCNALHPDEQPRAVTRITTDLSNVCVPGSGSDSLSGSGSDPGESERVIQPDDVIPTELREAAKMLSVQDIDGAWLKFCGHYAGQAQHVAGMWQKWCIGEARRERTERDRRNNPRYSPPGAPEATNPYDGPAIREERARRERERREAEKNAVPPPIGELLAAVGGSKP